MSTSLGVQVVAYFGRPCYIAIDFHTARKWKQQQQQLLLHHTTLFKRGNVGFQLTCLARLPGQERLASNYLLQAQSPCHKRLTSKLYDEAQLTCQDNF